jgi:nucleotide-binding universal stress UspA family protein
VKILLTHDGSTMADVAVPRVRALARAAGGGTEVTALCITRTHAAEGSSEAVEAADSLDRIRRALDPQAVTPMVLAGEPGPLIVETADGLGCDLIVMSTSGQSGSKHFLGSVADYVARHSQRVPVMLCRPEPAGSTHFVRILCPLDGSHLNADALSAAQALASATGAALVLLRLIDTTDSYAPSPRPRDISSMPSWRTTLC